MDKYLTIVVPHNLSKWAQIFLLSVKQSIQEDNEAFVKSYTLPEFNTQTQLFENSKKRNTGSIFLILAIIRKNLKMQNTVLINYEKCTWI